jgi:RHS repeat-associated protein
MYVDLCSFEPALAALEPVSRQSSFTRRLHCRFALGNTRLLLSAAAGVTDTYAYRAFGEELTITGSTVNPYRYRGQVGYYTDPAIRLYVRARHLDAVAGRWISRDPSLLQDGADWYLYARENPVKYSDPSGEISIDDQDVCGIPGARFTCIDRSRDRLNIVSGRITGRTEEDRRCGRLKPSNVLQACGRATQPGAGEVCVVTNGGFFNLRTGMPLGPLQDCRGVTSGGTSKDPDDTNGPLIRGAGDQVLGGRHLFDRQGQCNVPAFPRRKVGRRLVLDDKRDARTAACFKGT